MKVLAIILLISANMALAAGPEGFGSIKIGMTKEAIEGIPTTEEIHFVSALQPHETKYSKPTPGVDRFKALLATPFTKEPLEIILAFEGDVLTNLYISLEKLPSLFEQMKTQISEKYGEPAVTNTMKEEQCIYRGGANFKLMNGGMIYRWQQASPSAGTIQTSLLSHEINICPSNLRYGSIGPTKLMSLNIGVLKAKPESKATNPF